MKYQVLEWDLHFETNKSRLIDRCSSVYIPNKQHGLGYSRIMSEEDGGAIYGIWVMILCLCSQQRRPRAGWVTLDGHHEGTPMAPRDLALKFRRPQAEVERALNFLSSKEIGWLGATEVVNGELVVPSALEVPLKCPQGAPAVRIIDRLIDRYISPKQPDLFEGSDPLEIYNAYPRKVQRKDGLKAINKALKQTTFSDLLEKTKAYGKFCEEARIEQQFIPYPASWFNKGGYLDDLSAEALTRKAHQRANPRIDGTCNNATDYEQVPATHRGIRSGT